MYIIFFSMEGVQDSTFDLKTLLVEKLTVGCAYKEVLYM